MAEELLRCVEIEPPGGPATASVVWLHGLGASGHDFEPIVPELGLGPDHRVRFVFPHAPVMPVTLNFGMQMPAWYDIKTLNSRDDDEAGIRASSSHVERLLARERERGVSADRTVLAGFSQGGAVALFAGLRHAESLAGILVLSAYLLLADRLPAEAGEANRQVPILQCHGTRDPMVPESKGAAARDRLTALGYDVTYATWPMEHHVCLEEIQMIGEWLRERLPSAP